MEVEDFIPDYPQVGDKFFSYKIARKEEFRELKLSPYESKPRNIATPLLHQDIQSRFFSPHTDYDKELLFHAVGTGKTCSIAFIVENFKAYLRKDGTFRRALLLVPSRPLADSVREDIANVCTRIRTDLFSKEEEETLTAETKKRRIKKEVAKTYEIISYGNFVKKLGRSDEKLREEYNGRLIIIDEAHKIKLQDDKEEKKEKKKYDKIHHFLHIINARVLLLSGTVIWDKAYELAFLLNLILSHPNQLPAGAKFMKFYFDADSNLTKEGIAEMKSELIGKVSFLRQMMSTAQREEMGVIKPWMKHVKIYPSAMSDFQRKNAEKASTEVKIVTRAVKKGGKTVDIQYKTVGGAIRVSARNAGILVWPDGSYDSKSFDKYIVKDGKRYKYRNASIGRELYKNLAKYSSIYAAILYWITSRPNEVAFVYNELVKSGGGGAINFGLILEQAGFEWVRTAAALRRKSDKPKFIVLTSATAISGQIAEMLSIVSQPENKYGDICRVVIASKTAGHGLTIKNVRQAHDVAGWWNLSSGDQAFGRVFRFGTHDAFSKKEKYVRIFRHVGLAKGETGKVKDVDEGYPIGASFSPTKEMIGLKVYRIAEYKDYQNAQLYRLLKEIAWDCPLNYERNVLETDNDFSRACNYTKCNYYCDGYPKKYISKDDDVWKYDVPAKRIRYDTYNLFYSSKVIQILIEKVINVFREHFRLSLETLQVLISAKTREEKILTLLACRKIIDERISIRNRYGFLDFLKEDGNFYFLSQSMAIESSYTDSFYSEYPLVTEKIELKYLARIAQRVGDKEILAVFCRNPKEKLLSEMSYHTWIFLLEEYVKMIYKEDKTPREEAFFNVIDGSLADKFLVYDGDDKIHNMYAEEYTGTGYNITVKSRHPTGLMRIFRDKEKYWEYVGIENEEKYINLFKEEEKRKTGAVSIKDNPYGLYGFEEMKGDGSTVFKIWEEPRGEEKAKSGKVCSSWYIIELSRIIRKINEKVIELGGEIDDLALPDADMDDIIDRAKSKDKKDKVREIVSSKDSLINAIKKTRDNMGVLKDEKYLRDKDMEELHKIYYLSFMNRDQICSMLKEWFKEHKLFRE